jgi:hypothetical protein
MGEGLAGWQGEVIFTCKAELVNKLLGVLRHASGGLDREGEEVGLLGGRQLLVLVVLSERGLVGSGEGLAAGCG